MVHKNASMCLPVVPTVHKNAQCGPLHNAPHFLKLLALSCKHHARSRARRSLPSLPQLQPRGHPCFLHTSRPRHVCCNCGGHGYGAYQCKWKEPPNHRILTLIFATPPTMSCATRGPLSLFSTSASNTTMTSPCLWPPLRPLHFHPSGSACCRCICWVSGEIQKDVCVV